MNKSNKDFITITHGMRGWFAVHMWWNTDLGGFWEPYQSSDSSYDSPELAAADGVSWAKAEGLEFRR